jgi:uncharacterized membrane protein YkvA (DUF1232 family)
MSKIILTLLSMVYAISPYDLIPDFILGWGWLDDILVIYLLWHFILRGRGLPKREPNGPKDGDQTFFKDRRQSRVDSAAVQDPHLILGVAPDASQAQIKQAYKNLAAKYHPDKVHHLGDEFKNLAEKRFKEIQAAYQQLKSK